jgi:DNA-binding NarL/FixJ family response regulator
MAGKINVRILIADDHDVVRSGLRKVLEAHHGWEVVGEATNGTEAIDKAVETLPDVVILDYSMPVVNGIEATRQIRATLPKTEVLIFSMFDNEIVLGQALSAGARGFVFKTEAKAELTRAVASVAQGKPFFAGKISQRVAGAFVQHRGEERLDLTIRERSVLCLIAEGHTNMQIARSLDISVSTVETHRGTIKRKLDVGTSAGLVRYAIRHGIARLDG